MGSKWKTHLQPLLLPQGLKDVGPARPGASMGHAVKSSRLAGTSASCNRYVTTNCKICASCDRPPTCLPSQVRRPDLLPASEAMAR